MEEQATAAVQLKQLLDEDWENRMQADPLYATYTGDNRFNDRLPGVSEADVQKTLEEKCSVMKRLRLINLKQLPPEELLTQA